jgi:beta-phosphoglucomutase-like phosphatase (HAD superfamily)
MVDILPPAKLLLFDFDETLSMTERIRLMIRNAFLKEIGAKEFFNGEYKQNCIGKSLKNSIVPWLKKTRPEISLTQTELHDELKKREREMYQTKSMEPTNGAVRFLVLIQERRPNLKKAVCTGADRQDVSQKLRSAGLLRFFTPQEMYSREEANGLFKPSPAMYLAAYLAFAHNISMEEVRVFEDNEEGVRAGLEAGFPTIAMPSEWSKEQDFRGAILAPNGFLDILEYSQYYLGFKL